jgi:flavin reductase (DIM6/NTAB) family NADH-FMN oxidoreductase RutF
MGVDGQDLRRAMRQWATGVAVVTSRTPAGPHGITVNSFTSLSLEPPLCLICIDRRARAHHEIPRAGGFVVNVLGEDQEEIAARFAGRRPELQDPFAGLETTSAPSGMPVFAGVLSYLDCTLEAQFPGGDHTIFVGRVSHAEVPGAQPPGADGSLPRFPLLFYGGAFQRLARP